MATIRICRSPVDPVDRPPNLARRRLLKSALLAAPAIIAARYAGPVEAATESRRIGLLNTHTSESLEAVFFKAGEYQSNVLRQLNRILRDHRTGDVGAIDPKLFDQLFDVADAAGVDPEFEVISGFRSAASNELLRSHSNGVARRSLHLEGRAIDVRLKDVKSERLCEVALDLGRGGVGLYRKSDFVHLDTGRVRHWSG
jgi:uncharacterized protein YcbK (DUF882 family)